MGEERESDEFFNRVGGERISSRQIDELIGLCRGMAADGAINQGEIEFLQKWLAANVEISGQPVIRTLYGRINDILGDNVADKGECEDLLATLHDFTRGDIELGEVLKSTSLPLCNPPPILTFPDKRYCFTGTFSFGKRKQCEDAVAKLGATSGSLTQKTNVLVIGVYATDSWKHSAFGNKILQAVEWRDEGIPISVVSEEHWRLHL